MLAISPFLPLLFAFPFCLLAAAITDLQRFIIPNWTSVALVAGFFAAAFSVGLSLNAVLLHIAVGVAVLLLGFLLFEAGLWGGGDGKLIAATAIWFDPHTALAFLFYTVMAGGLLGVVSVVAIAIHNNHSAFPGLAGVDPPILQRLRVKSPYGVAIAAGAFLTFPGTELFARLFFGAPAN